ncbi:MAG: histidine phosphatase family protein [Acidobacteria bacterium]|nr:histidine phosphatase family protein [Acidobacteriota bacterium]
MTIHDSHLPRDPGVWPRRVFVARHGRSVWNKSKRVSGQANPPLADEGHAQATRMAEALADESLHAVYSSDLDRAIQTAAPTAERFALRVQPSAALREQHFGIAEGQQRDDPESEIGRLWQARLLDREHFRMPGGGESYVEMETRVLEWLRPTLAAHRGENVLVIGHRNSTRVLLGALLGLARTDVMALPVHARWLYVIAPGDEPVGVWSCSLRERDAGRRVAGLRT